MFVSNVVITRMMYYIDCICTVCLMTMKIMLVNMEKIQMDENDRFIFRLNLDLLLDKLNG